MGEIKKTFVSGLLVTLPVVVTGFILVWVFQLLDSVLGDAVEEITGYTLPGVGLLLALALVFGVGLMTRIYVGKKLLGWGDNLLARIPLVRIIYVSTRQILQTLTSNNRAFRDVVVLEYPRRELFALGFVTGYTPRVPGDQPERLDRLFADVFRAANLPEARSTLRQRRLLRPEDYPEEKEPGSPPAPNLADDSLIHVFVPTTPNPTSGYVLLVPCREVVFLQASVEDSVRFVISGGVLPLGEAGEADASDSAPGEGL